MKILFQEANKAKHSQTPSKSVTRSFLYHFNEIKLNAKDIGGRTNKNDFEMKRTREFSFDILL